jgi:4-hydroxybenzoate polyprenyltransferase
MHRVVIVPILQIHGFDNNFRDDIFFSLLTLATILIAAGGYILNDYFDMKIDAINHPERQIVGKIIDRSKAMRLHQIFTTIGTLIGIGLSIYTRSFSIGFIFITVPGLLWFYSASYKRQFLIGNLTIAFISMITVLLVGIFQISLLELRYDKLIYETPIPQFIYSWIGGFAFFSFMLTLIREIVKDMEDEKGDRELECRTLPIVWGQKNTKIVLYVLIAFILLALFYIERFHIPFDGSLTLNFLLYGILVPFIALIYLILKASTPKDFNQVSFLCKIIMLIGISYSIIFNFLAAKLYGLILFDLFLVK